MIIERHAFFILFFIIHTSWWPRWGRIHQGVWKWLQKSCLPTDFSISSAQEATVLYRYLTQTAASLCLDFLKHLADCMQISSWLVHKLASRNLLLRLITKGAWSVHLERVSVGVCVLAGWSSESIVTGPVASPQAPSHSMKPASLNWTIKHLHIVAGFFFPHFSSGQASRFWINSWAC